MKSWGVVITGLQLGGEVRETARGTFRLAPFGNLAPILPVSNAV